MKKFPIKIIFILIIIVLAIWGYFTFKINKNVSEKSIVDDSKLFFTEQTAKSDNSTIESQQYQNKDHNLIINYSKNWFKFDLGGTKNITEPDTRENIIYFYDAKDQLDVNSDSQDIFASVKIIRYRLDSGVNIDSSDSWFNYVKDKVETYKVSSLAGASNYQLNSVNKLPDINNVWAVEEQYREIGDVKAKDIYLYHDGQFFQLICKTESNSYDYYLPYFDLIINSFTINK